MTFNAEFINNWQSNTNIRGMIQEEENLLQDSIQLTESAFICHNGKADPPTVKIQRGAFSMHDSELELSLSNSSLAKYLTNDSQVRKETISTKSFKRLNKQKEQFLAMDPNIQRIWLKPTSKSQKVNEMLNFIQAQKAQKYYKRLKSYQEELIELADELINQRKHLQRQIDQIIDMNKIMKAKLKEIEKYFEQINQRKDRSCGCGHDFSFSKSKESPLSYLDRFSFAKTIINSIEELQLKKVEEEEDLSLPEMPFVELIWSFKNKIQDKNFKISHGLIDRVATGQTLKQWIIKIDQKLSTIPEVTNFQVALQGKIEDCSMKDFIQLLNNESQTFMQNLQMSKDRQRQLEVIKTTTLNTFIQILQEEYRFYSKDEAMAYFGDVTRCLTLLQKKSAIHACPENFSSQEVMAHIEALYS